MENATCDWATQISHIWMYYKLPGRADEFVEEMKLRIYFPQELDALLKHNGFMIEHKYGDYDESPK